MKAFNLITLVLTIVAGLDVGSVGLFNMDFLAYLFGVGTTLARAVEIVLGLSALYQLSPFFKALKMGEIRAEVSHG